MQETTTQERAMTHQPTFYLALLEHCPAEGAGVQPVRDADIAVAITDEAFGSGWSQWGIGVEDPTTGAWLIPLPKPLDALVDAGGSIVVTTVNGATVTVEGADVWWRSTGPRPVRSTPSASIEHVDRCHRAAIEDK